MWVKNRIKNITIVYTSYYNGREPWIHVPIHSIYHTQIYSCFALPFLDVWPWFSFAQPFWNARFWVLYDYFAMCSCILHSHFVMLVPGFCTTILQCLSVLFLALLFRNVCPWVLYYHFVLYVLYVPVCCTATLRCVYHVIH